MAIGIVTAGGGHSWETGVVAEMSRAGAPLTVIRRCADMADVLAVAATGQIRAALLAADARRLDADSVSELAAFGVVVVAVHRAGDPTAGERLRRIGVAGTVPDDAPAGVIVQAVNAAVAHGGDVEPAGPRTVGADPARALRDHAVGDRGAHPGGFVPDAQAATAEQPTRRLTTRRPRGNEPEPAGVAAGAGSDASDRGQRRSRRSRRGDARPAHAVRAGRRGRSSVTPGGAPPESGSPRKGRVVAIWGPVGAPGRSTVAMGLADRLVAAGSSVLLIDADVYGGVLASAFGLLDESAGLAGACRLASNGRLGSSEFAGLCWQIRDSLTLMTGISRADRWPELRPSAIAKVLDQARAAAEVVVVDCASLLEADEEISFDTLAPRRNGATLAVIGSADQVIAVGSADPAGMERFARAYGDLTEAMAGSEPIIVFNRVRSSAASSAEVREASRRFCGKDPQALLPEDRAVVDLAWQRGVTISMVSAKSPLIGALDELVAALP